MDKICQSVALASVEGAVSVLAASIVFCRFLAWLSAMTCSMVRWSRLFSLGTGIESMSNNHQIPKQYKARNIWQETVSTAKLTFRIGRDQL